jgi:hypothetical protein
MDEVSGAKSRSYSASRASVRGDPTTARPRWTWAAVSATVSRTTS